MTIRKSAYDTTACQGFQLDKTVMSVKEALMSGWVEWLNGNRVGAIQGGSSVADNVKAFAHPLVIQNDNNEYVVFDARPFGKYDPHQHQFLVRNTIEFELARHRTVLNAIWLTESPTILRDISSLPMGVFASWVSENIARRFALDPREQLNLAVLAAIFYNSQFLEHDELQLEERDKLRVTNAISRALRCQADDVLTVLDQVSVVNSVVDFCNHAEAVSGSIRLKEFNNNPGLLFAILGGTWFGTNAREMVAVALEHPPTWLAILLAAFTERTFKNSAITKITERSGFRAAGTDYVRAIKRLVDTFTEA